MKSYTFKDRLREFSTYAGLAMIAFAPVLAHYFPPSSLAALAEAVHAFAAAALVFIPENKHFASVIAEANEVIDTVAKAMPGDYGDALVKAEVAVPAQVYPGGIVNVPNPADPAGLAQAIASLKQGGFPAQAAPVLMQNSLGPVSSPAPGSN